MNVLLEVVVLAERLRTFHWVSIGFAAAVVVYFAVVQAPGSRLFPYTTLFRSQSGSSEPTASHTTFRFGNFPPVRPPATVSACSSGSPSRSEEHTSELQSLAYLVCRLLLEKKKSSRR